jgi:hypothetical protein
MNLISSLSKQEVRERRVGWRSTSLYIASEWEKTVEGEYTSLELKTYISVYNGEGNNQHLQYIEHILQKTKNKKQKKTKQGLPSSLYSGRRRVATLMILGLFYLDFRQM